MADCYESLIAEHGWKFWAVELKETYEFIGFVGLHIPTAKLPFSLCVEIGWQLALRSWAKGFTSEAARSSLVFGFKSLGLVEIVSFNNIRNLRLGAVMERLGMLNINTAGTLEHPDVPINSGLRKHSFYWLSYQQWMIYIGYQGVQPYLLHRHLDLNSKNVMFLFTC